MAPANEAAALQVLVPTLLDFERAPGRYAVALREPRPLFDATHAVMLLAAGRPVEGLPPLMPGQHTGAVQHAARFFVRTVLLRPGVDHYGLLGLQPGFEPETLRDHYRLMIRLTHPDFAASGEAWPDDAASRINIANDVLGSVVKRAEYDASLQTVAGASPLASPLINPLNHPLVAMPGAPESPLAEARRAARAKPVREDFEGREAASRRHRKMALVAGGALACAVLLWLMTPSGNEGSLVAQRSQPAAVAPTAEATETGLLATTPDTSADPAQAPAPNSAALMAASVPADAAAPTGDGAPREAAKAALMSQLAAVQKAEAIKAAREARAERAAARALALQAKAEQTQAAAGKSEPPEPQEPEGRRLALGMDKHLSLPPGRAAQPVSGLTLAANAPAPAAATVAAASEPATPAVNKVPLAAEPAEPAEPALTMASVQPKLAQLLSGLQSGKGENVTQWLEGHWRDHPAASTFVKNYTRAVAGQQVLQLGKVKLRSRSVQEQLVVDGVVELYVQDANAVQQIKELQMSAYFTPKDGQAMLTQVVLVRP